MSNSQTQIVSIIFLFFIVRLQISDGVDYRCQATNVAGRQAADFHVTVLVPPVMRDTDVVDHIEVRKLFCAKISTSNKSLTFQIIC